MTANMQKKSQSKKIDSLSITMKKENYEQQII